MSDRELEALTKELDRMRRENAALRAMAAEKFGELDIVVTPDGAALLRTWAKAPQHVALLVQLGTDKLRDIRIRNDSLGLQYVHEVAMEAHKYASPIDASDQMLARSQFDARGLIRRGDFNELGNPNLPSPPRFDPNDPRVWANATGNPKDDAARALRMLSYSDLGVSSKLPFIP